jgi:predicted anti-sigma-YlaC factor YlaD
MSPHVVESLSAYLDGELAAAERQAVESHLQACDECARHLEAFAAVDELARALPLEAPGGYFDALPARVRFKVTARQRRAPRLPAWSWAVAAALLVAVVTPVLLRQNPKPAEVPRAVAPAPPAPPASAADSAAPQEPLPTAGPATAEARQKANAASDEAQARVAPEKLARATPPLAPAPAAPAPAAAQAPTGGTAQGTLASNQAAAPLVKAEEARAKDKEGFAQDPGRTPGPRAARTRAAPPEASSLEGAAGQHLYEPKPEADEVAAPALTVQEATAEAKQTGAAGAAATAGRRDAEVGRSEAPAPKLLFRDLKSQVAGNAEDARRLREEWRAFVAQAPPADRADEGRVRIVEMGVLAFQLSNEPADRILAKRDAEAYLRRDDAAQGSRVRALLATLGN